MRHRLTAFVLAVAATVAACSDSGTGPEPEPNPPVWAGTWTDTTAGVRAVFVVPVRFTTYTPDLALTRLADGRTEYYEGRSVTVVATTPPRLEGRLAPAGVANELSGWFSGSLTGASPDRVTGEERDMALVLTPLGGSRIANGDTLRFSLRKQP